MKNITTLVSDPVADTIPGRDFHNELRAALSALGRRLCRDCSLENAESVIDEVGDLIGLTLCWWTPDSASPYINKRARQYLTQRGLPTELMDLWRKYQVRLYSPSYVRSRFEILPYVTQPDISNRQPYCPGYFQVNQALMDMGIKSMLHVPIHLAKGRIGLINWAGDRDHTGLRELMTEISGEVLAIGYLFMRVYMAQFGQDDTVIEEKSRLTLREWDCLRMLAQGYREAEAADLLHISKSTLRFHVDNAVRKFGCKNRTHVVAMTAQLGLLGPLGN